jgi:hypothetical protein
VAGTDRLDQPRPNDGHLTVYSPQPDRVFDIFFAPGLLPTNGFWWVARGLPCQTNFTIRNLPVDAGYFVAGTTNSLDGVLTIAYSHFVGGLNTLTNDLDGDGCPTRGR